MITIVDYGLGNLGSIRNMMARSGIECVISCDPRTISVASRLILPGVGHFAFAMESLKRRGVVELLVERVRSKVPLLGICLGAQLVGRHSEEGDIEGLGFVPMNVVAFDRDRLTRNEK